MNTIKTNVPKLRPNNETPGPEYPQHMRDWLDLCARHRFLWVTSCNDLRESPPPAAMPAAEFLHLVGALLNVQQRQVLKELLLDLLREDLVELLQWYGGSDQ